MTARPDFRSGNFKPFASYFWFFDHRPLNPVIKEITSFRKSDVKKSAPELVVYEIDQEESFVWQEYNTWRQVFMTTLEQIHSLRTFTVRKFVRIDSVLPCDNSVLTRVFTTLRYDKEVTVSATCEMIEWNTCLQISMENSTICPLHRSYSGLWG